MRIFIGYDPRQPVAVQVLAHSIYSRASAPVSVTPLVLSQLPLKRKGLTEFTFSRYVVPHLCNYEGDAVFMDADMLCLADIHELRSICIDHDASVFVSKNRLRFEWPSLMYFKNKNCMALTLDAIENGQPQSLDWALKIGELPPEWNHLVGYDNPRMDAKVVHFTQGIPCFRETAGCEYEKEWQEEVRRCNGTVSWTDIMGGSVHAKPVIERLAARAAA